MGSHGERETARPTEDVLGNGEGGTAREISLPARESAGSGQRSEDGVPRSEKPRSQPETWIFHTRENTLRRAEPIRRKNFKHPLYPHPFPYPLNKASDTSNAPFRACQIPRNFFWKFVDFYNVSKLLVNILLNYNVS